MAFNPALYFRHGRRFIAGGEEPPPEAWVPADDTSLVSRYDSSDTASITHSTGTVSAIADKEGPNGLTTSSGVTTGSTTLNGLNVVTYNGAASGFPQKVGFAYGGSGNLAIHGVMQIGTVDNINDALISLQGSTNYLSVTANNATVFNARILPDPVNLGGSNTTFTGIPYAGWINFSLVLDYTASEVRAYVGDILRATMTGYNVAPINDNFQLLLLSNRQGVQTLPGAIAELCFTTNTANRSDYYTYLNEKWAVT